MLLIPRLPISLPAISQPQRIAIDSPDLNVQCTWQSAVEMCPSTLRRFYEGVVQGADFDLVGIENRDGESVMARVQSRTLVQLVLNDVHAIPAGWVAAGNILC